MRFRGQVALVTGAAGGIARAACERMAREGAVIAAVDLDADRLQSMVEAGRAQGWRMDAYAGDAGDEAHVRETVARVAREHGSIDVLVNAIGGSTIIANANAGVEEVSLAEWQALLDFNLRSMFLFCSAVAPVMKAKSGGKIVNLSSIAGRGISVASSIGYAAAKGGVNAFTRKLSLELGPHGITVNAIAPSLTLTERILPHWQRRTEAQREAVRMQIPLRRLPTAEDQANVICFLASSDADFITGVSLDVTGGQ